MGFDVTNCIVEGNGNPCPDSVPSIQFPQAGYSGLTSAPGCVWPGGPQNAWAARRGTARPALKRDTPARVPLGYESAISAAPVAGNSDPSWDLEPVGYADLGRKKIYRILPCAPYS